MLEELEKERKHVTESSNVIRQLRLELDESRDARQELEEHQEKLQIVVVR